MSMHPRPYQQAAIDAVVSRFAENYRSVLAVMATGTGKTIVFTHLAHQMLAHGRVMVVAHREELIRQAAKKMQAVTGIMPAMEKAEEASDENCMHGKAQIVVASVQTLNADLGTKKRISKFDPMEFSLLVIDEGHHVLASTWSAVVNYFLAGNPDLKVLCVTATPDRGDGENLGAVCDTVAYTYDLPEAISDGYLVKPRQRSVVIDGLDFSKVGTRAGDLAQDDLEAAMIAEKPLHGIAHATLEVACGLPPGSLASIKDAPDRVARLESLIEGKRRRKTLVFTVSVAHADRMAEILNRWIPGSAMHISGTTDKEERPKILKGFARGEFQFLVNCAIATEGFDEPSIECIVIARPTKSRPLFAQMIGRGTRPLEEIAHDLGTLPHASARREAIAASPKPFVEILDFVGNSGRHRLVCAFDLLCGQHDEAVVDRAKKLAQAGAVDLDDALEEAAAEVQEQREVEQVRAEMEAEIGELRKQEADEVRRRDTAKRAALVGTATNYYLEEVDGLDPHHSSPARESGINQGGASEKQIALLVVLGVQRPTAVGYCLRQASAVISSLKSKRCTTKQGYRLRQMGFSEPEIQSMNFQTASDTIGMDQREGARA